MMKLSALFLVFAKLALAVIVTVGPGGGPTYDYSSLNAAEAGEQQDLVALADQMVIECYNFEDVTAVTFDGWTTSPVYNITLTVAPGNRHDGKWSMSGYRLTNSGVPLEIKEEDVTISWMQIYSSGASSVIQINGTFARTIEFDHCIIRGSSSTVNGLIEHNVFPDHGPILKASNSLLYDQLSSSFGAAFFLVGAGTAPIGQLIIYNNTIVTSRDGVLTGKPWGLDMKNNIFSVVTAVTEGTGLTYTGDYNSTTLADFGSVTPNTNDNVSQTFTFVDAGASDFHLGPTDTGAQALGTDLSTDPDLPVTDDIDEQSRVGAVYDIGMDQINLPPTTGTMRRLMMSQAIYWR